MQVFYWSYVTFSACHMMLLTLTLEKFGLQSKVQTNVLLMKLKWDSNPPEIENKDIK